MRIILIRYFIFILLLFQYLFVFSQENNQFYIVIDDPEFKSQILKESESANKSSVLKRYDDVFENYEISEFVQAFPTAKSEFLKNVYYLDVKNGKGMASEIRGKLKNKISYIEELCKPMLTHEPNDYNLYPENEDYYYLDIIKAKEAWDMVMGLQPVKIAITDTYFDPNHEDLTFKEIRGTNNPNALSYEHGTSVAGIIAAKIDNGKGIASIGGYTSELTASSNWGSDQEVLLLAQAGNRVINCSWINSCSYSPVRDSLYKEIKKEWNCVTVFGAGNSVDHCGSLSAKVYPASYSNCLSVTSISHLFNRGRLDEDGRKKYWKDVHERFAGEGNSHHHNDAVDICAPGFYLKTTDVSGERGYSSSDYCHGWGTSYAAPLVTGTLSMIFAINPCLTADEAVDILLDSSDASIYDIPENYPYIGQLGKGRLDAYAAALMAAQTATLQIRDTTLERDSLFQSNYAIYCKNLTIMPSNSVYLKTRKEIILDKGVEVKKGAELIIDVNTQNGVVCN